MCRKKGIHAASRIPPLADLEGLASLAIVGAPDRRRLFDLQGVLAGDAHLSDGTRTDELSPEDLETLRSPGYVD